jgi:hypothetical protein
VRKSKEEDEERSASREATIHHDIVNEQAVLAAVVADWDGEAAKLLDKHQPDTFLAEEHRAAWAALQELRRRKLAYDPAMLRRYAGPKCDVEYLEKLFGMRPDAPASADLDHFVEGLLWDRQRAAAITGPISALLEAVRDPRADQARVRALARHVGEAFQGGTGRGRFIHDGQELVRSQMQEVRKRVAGHASYSYGIEGLDVNLETGERRLLPGPAPGQITVFTAVPGSGKTTAAGRVTLGIARQRRRVLYGAYEMGGGMTLELLACMSLDWSRSRLMKGYTQDQNAPAKDPMGAHEQIELEERMHQINRYVRFMRNPFRSRGGQKRSNERNLDVIQEQIVDSGCEVFVADLWKRCLVDTRPEAEEDALTQQQLMMEETRTHGILLQQQRSKDVEQRPDKRPTREGIKGSSAWVEVADTIIGWHLPSLWKSVSADTIEGFVLKQRYGPYPLGVEFGWSAEHGSITGGTPIEYKHTAAEEGGVFGGEFRSPEMSGNRGKRGKKS